MVQLFSSNQRHALNRDPETSRTRTPGYEGEDVSPTTSRELRGFYAYGLTAEIFAVCGVGEFSLRINIYLTNKL